MHPHILILTQGHAGDRLGARLATSLFAEFPGGRVSGLGGARMKSAGISLLARTDSLSAMGYSGLLPVLPRALAAAYQAGAASRTDLPDVVLAVDFWQPLQFLHRVAPHLGSLPHVCYLPPGPNFVGQTRVHGAVATFFRAVVSPFPHQTRLYSAGGATVIPGAHAGLEMCMEEATPLPSHARKPLLAILPGSRPLEVRSGLRQQAEAARQITRKHPHLEPVVCCASEAVERVVARLCPDFERTRETRRVLAEAEFGIVCSGTAVLEAMIFGCPGVLTYHGSSLQRWEWRRFHLPGLTRLRAAGIASPFIGMPNIISGEELYPELLQAEAGGIADAALEVMSKSLCSRRSSLAEITQTLAWNPAGPAVAEAIRIALSNRG